LQLEELLSAKARERQATSTGGANPQLMANLPEADTETTTRDGISKAAASVTV
jgi:hypothetical protein